MVNKITPELLEKAELAKSAEELLALAKENGAEITAEEANTYFAGLNPKTGELSDELNDVAGGGCIAEAFKESLPKIPDEAIETGSNLPKK